MIEAAPAIGEVGAGIQVSPNVSRLLIRWGLGPQLEKIAVRPEALVLRRYANGERIGYARWGNVIEREQGAPYYHIHRADFHKLLYDLAVPNITLRLNSFVTKVDPEGPSVTLASGEVITGDLLIGADGIKSIVQGSIVTPSPPTPTGDAAYRVIIPADAMEKDPELKPFLDHPEMTGWMAPGRHLMAYPIVRLSPSYREVTLPLSICCTQRAKKQYNLVLLHPDDGSVESWTAEGSADRMRAEFADFEPR
jgi:salicylate hydroxylase